MKQILVGSKYFFKDLEGFKSKYTYKLLVLDNGITAKKVLSISG